MNKERLQNARDYFDNITAIAYRQFVDSEITFLIVYSMVASLYHMAEWVYFHDEAKVTEKYGNQIKSGGDLWNKVVAAEIADAGFIRDLNNTAKHVKLRFDPQHPRKGDPSTKMHFAANTFISMLVSGGNESSQGSNSGCVDVKMDEDGREVRLEPVATAVFKFWEVLMDEFYPNHAKTIAIDENALPTANS